jgi:hypothetical protein
MEPRHRPSLIDRRWVGVDGLVALIAGVPRALAFGLHYLQRGALQAYALGMVIGVVVLLLLWNWTG